MQVEKNVKGSCVCGTRGNVYDKERREEKKPRMYVTRNMCKCERLESENKKRIYNEEE